LIHESYYWKNELYKSFQIIAKFRNLTRIHELSFIKVEKALLIGAYIIRKLNDASKLPPKLMAQREVIDVYTGPGKIVDYLNWDKIERLYNLDEKRSKRFEWMFIINQLIHSYALIYTFDEHNKLESFLINSDKTKKNSLFVFRVETILKIFLSISEGDITSAQSQREIIGKKDNGEPLYGEMKLINAIYSYPDGFNLQKSIKDTLKGRIYQRKN
jgi:hypothetical protein